MDSGRTVGGRADARYLALTAEEVISGHLETVFRAHAGELLGRVEVQELLDSLARATPGLVTDVVPA